MTKASDNLFPGIILNEAATDGSDFSNPSADYRRLFLGEDGFLHVKDSAGAVTSPYDSSAGATNVTGAYDIEGDGSPTYTDAGMSDEFASGTIDAQWTAVGMTTGTIDDTATNIADSIYDLGTESGTMFIQLDQGDACGIRQDAIPAAGAQIIVSMWIPYPHDTAVGGTANSFRCGVGVNDNNTLYNSGNYRMMMWDGNDDPRVVMYEGATIYSEHKYSSPAGGRIYFRIKRVSTTLYYYWSRDGIGWNALTSVAVGTYDNFWIWWDASVAAGMDGAPIAQVMWVRHVANVNYRPW